MTQQSTQQSMISTGWDVYGSDDEKIGTVDEVGQNYLLVRKGLIFTRDVYVPTSAIAQVDPGQTAVLLTVPKDDVDAQDWSVPPSDTGAWRAGTDAAYGQTGAPASGWTEESGARSEHGTSDESIRVPRYEEELRAGTQTRETGQVEIRKDVREEQQTVDVPVTREDVEVRRVAANRDVSPDEAAFTNAGDTIRVPLREEQVVVSKEPRVAEELEVRKVAQQDTERVSDTVRREEIDVQRTGETRTGEGWSTGTDVDDINRDRTSR